MTKGSYPAGGGSTPSVKPMAGPRIPAKASVGSPPQAGEMQKQGLMPRHAARMAAKAHKGGK